MEEQTEKNTDNVIGLFQDEPLYEKRRREAVMNNPLLEKWRHDPETGRAYARDEMAAAMDDDFVPIDRIQKMLAYPNFESTRAAIHRGQRYQRHLLLAQLRRVKNKQRKREGKKAKPPVWTAEAVELLKKRYSDHSIDLHVLAQLITEVANGTVTREAVIGKAYRMQLKRGHPPHRQEA